tara:strand:- start:10565 stop:10864 length:300 start_codon:yes stop_codon:yes gene_type:complete
MNSTEIILAILLLLSFSVFIVGAENKIIENTNSLKNKFIEKTAFSECTALVNMYYAHSGGELNENLTCNKRNIISSEIQILENGVIIGVENHYGKRTDF